MKILLISSNKTSIVMTCFPLGVACIAGTLKKDRHDVEIYDFLEENSSIIELTKKINSFNPELIGISVRNIDNQDPFNTQIFLPEIREIVRTCHNVSKSPVIIGGAGYSIFPYSSLKYLEGDYGVPGEGEKAIRLLARNIEKGLSIDSLSCVIKAGDVTKKYSQRKDNFKTIPLPARELFHLEEYIKKSPMPIQGKRGCQMKCIYCPSPLIESRKIRFRPPEAIAEELEVSRKKYEINNFFFVDSIFNYPEDHAISLCKEIVRRKLDIKWQCTINPFHLTDRLVKWMKKANCTEVSLGFESGSEKILKVLKKGFSKDDIKKAVKLLRKYEIIPAGFLLFGGPGESRKSVEDSFSFAERLKLEILYISPGIRIYPGTELAKIAVNEGTISSDDFLSPAFYISHEVKDWIYEECQEKTKNHPGWMI